MACSRPPATSTTLERLGTTPKDVRLVNVPFPSWPLLFRPDVHTARGATRRRQGCAESAATVSAAAAAAAPRRASGRRLGAGRSHPRWSSSGVGPIVPRARTISCQSRKFSPNVVDASLGVSGRRPARVGLTTRTPCEGIHEGLVDCRRVGHGGPQRAPPADTEGPPP